VSEDLFFFYQAGPVFTTLSRTEGRHVSLHLLSPLVFLSDRMKDKAGGRKGEGNKGKGEKQE